MSSVHYFLWSATAFVILSTNIAMFIKNANRNPIVTVSDGSIQGRFAEAEEADYYAFEGIPYASPPVGNLRFMRPVPLQPWSGILNATKPRSICYSSSISTWPVAGNDENEDCLFLNVYTPTINVSANLAVMIYIYGGKFCQLCSHENLACKIGGPEYFMTKNVVLVHFNYRVGPFGFLSTGDGVITGNAGLKDQVMAFKWVQKNIHLFGGDPQKVTIFGQSAGGASVGLHILSTQSKGLFRAGICESGSGLMNDTVQQNPKGQAQMLIKTLTNEKIDINDSKKIKVYLQSLDAKQIMHGSISMEKNMFYFFPVLEVNSTDPFLTEPHYEIAASGPGNSVPLIMGGVSEEALLFYSSVPEVKAAANSYDNDPVQLIPGNLKSKPGLSLEFLGQKVKEIYVNNDTFTNNINKVLEHDSDRTFIRSIIQQAKFHSRFASVYVYEFCHYRPDQYSLIIPGAGTVRHAAELHYLFKGTSSVNDTAVDKLTSKRLLQLWTNFAKYLNPTPNKSELFNITWPTIGESESEFIVLSINDTLSLKTDWKTKTFAKWQKYFEDYGVRPFLTF